MQIITRIWMRWNGHEFKLGGWRSCEYEGVLAQAKGETTQEVVPTGPWGAQIPYLQQLFSGAQQLLQQGPPQYYPGQTVAGSPNLAQNQSDILGTIAQNQPIAQGATNTAAGAATTANPVSGAAQPLVPALQSGLLALIQGQNPQLGFGQAQQGNAATAIGNAINTPAPGINTAGAPQNAVGAINAVPELQSSLQGGSLNPFLDQIVQGATRNLNRQFTQETIPGVRDAAMAAGQRGGSGEGIARGMAAENLQDNVADITARLFGQAFDTGAAERQNALGIISNASAQNPQLQLQGAALNQQGQQTQQSLGLQGADLALQQLAGGTQNAVQGVSAGTAQTGDLLSTGNAQGLTQLFQSLGLIPSLQGSQLAQLGVGNQVGLQQLGQGQAQIDSDIAKFFFEQFAPYASLAQFQNFIGGQYGGSVGSGSYGTAQPGAGTAPGAAPAPGYTPPTGGTQPGVGLGHWEQRGKGAIWVPGG